jgi:hypothetical protein
MCNFYWLESPCGHGTLVAAGTYCRLFFNQLQRINDPQERSRPGLPFDVPQQCLPNQGNVMRRFVNEYCSVECRNNSLYGPRLGAPGARFGPGSERIGVGWQY